MKKVTVGALLILSSLGCGGEDRSSTAMQVVVGDGHACVSRNGRVWCWGADDAGQIGRATLPRGMVTDTDTVLVPGLDDVVELAASDGHTCARQRDGRVACWGANGYGETATISALDGTCSTILSDVGVVNVACQPIPTVVPGLADARQLALGEQRSCARLASGAVHCWGQAARGADWAARRQGVEQLALGSQEACVGQSDGRLACSGSQPATIQDWTGVQQLAMSARAELSCVRHERGRVNCWGDNASGQRGIGNTEPMIPLPGDPPAITDGASAIAVGWSHACALVQGDVWCWGRNGSGAAGQPLTSSANCPGGPCLTRPRRVEGLPPVTALAAGGQSTCVVTADHRLFCWGKLQGRNQYEAPTHVSGPWEAPP